MFTVSCKNCGYEEMFLSSFAETEDSVKQHPSARCGYWLCKFVCPRCVFVETVSVGKRTGDFYFRTKSSLTLWHYCVLNGRWKR